MNRALVIAALAAALGVLGPACGAGENAEGFSEADAERWFTRYVKQVMSWEEQAESAEAPAKRKDFHTVGKIVKKLGRQGGQVRSDFAHVPTNLRNGEHLYRMLIDAGDAAEEWALIYQTDPPPYGATTAGLQKGQKLADAVVRFQQRTNRVIRFVFAHKDETLTE